MGEIFNALEVLNRTMKLGLSSQQVLRAEMGFKSALAQQGNPNPELPSDPVALAEGYELVATLRPRQEALSLGQLSTFARREMNRPRTKVDARTLKQIDRALAAAPQKTVKAASPPTAAKAGAKTAKTAAKAQKAASRKKA